MTSVPAALLRAICQLADPAILRVLGKSLIVTLLLFAVLGAALFPLIGAGAAWLGLHGNTEATYLAAIVLTVLAGWLLFRFVALAVVQFFADEIVHAVEARHYPEAAARARTVPLREEIAAGLKGLVGALVANLVALPFALALLVTGIGTALLFFALNAWLIGRELQDMAWLRHAHPGETGAPLSGGTRLLLGGAIAALLLVPFANLLAPVIGAAGAVHLVQRKTGKFA